jgi:hypothetical protein
LRVSPFPPPPCPAPPPPPQEVNERLQTASETRRKINAACEDYRPVARRAQILYFLIAQFAGVNCMYQARGQGLDAAGVCVCEPCAA